MENGAPIVGYPLIVMIAAGFPVIENILLVLPGTVVVPGEEIPFAPILRAVQVKVLAGGVGVACKDLKG